MKEHKINEINEIIEHEEYPDIKFIVIESETFTCKDCVFNQDNLDANCNYIPCVSNERSDDKNVHYEYYEENE